MEKIRILHIDDSIHDRMLVMDALEKESSDFEVVGVDSREKFEEHLLASDFDMVLSDFDILGFEGLEVLRIVKNKNRDIPVIIVTGTGSEEVAIEAMKMGASDYIIKSANHIRGIGHSIMMVLENKRTQEASRRAMAAQRESEDLYRSIYDNSSVAILLTAPDDGLVLSANGFACQLFEMTEEELCQAGREGLIDHSDNRVAELMRDRTEHGHAKGELTFVKKGGTKFQAEISSVIFYDKDGNKRSSMVIRDLTEQRAAEKKLITMSKAIEQSPTSIIITDARGTIEFVNNQFTEFMQYTLSDVEGKRPRIFNEGHTSKEKFDEMWETLHSGKTWFGESENRKKDGTRFIENAIISPLIKASGAISNYILIMEDITEKKKMLDDLIVAKEKAEESDRLKTAFLHNISHEIRTPMNAIIGFSGFLTDPDLSLEKRMQFTDVIVQSSNQLLSIITDIISIATIEAGQEKIQDEEVNLNSLLRLLYDQFLLKARKQKIELEYKTTLSDEDSLIMIDDIKLNEILNNLIGNALKFTDHGRVGYRYDLKGEFLEFCVYDTGIGVAHEMQDEIFQRFRQVEYTSNRQFGGAGLGLSISKSYVELLGGKIWLKSELGKGSEFYFTIPYKKVGKPTIVENRTANELKYDDMDNKKILVAEDERTNYMLLVALLSKLNLHIIRAENGVQAVELCDKNPDFDLVLMDIKMPEMDGFEATRRIKKKYPDLPVIALTAFTSDLDKQKAFDCGCSEFVGKPIDRNELIAKINMFLKK